MKRFTETTKWAKPWYRGLPARIKCLWSFICDNADAAGVWEPDFELASFQIGEPITEADLAFFDTRIARLEDGKIVVLSFIEFQYGNLSPDCKAHAPVFRALDKHSLSKGYPKAMHSLKDQDKDKNRKKGVQGEGEEAPEEPGAVAECWNAQPTLPRVILPLNAARAARLKARFQEPLFRERYAEAIQRASTSPFCRGDNDRGWKATFDWLLQPDTLTKILEGKYDGSSKTHPAGSSRNAGTANASEGVSYAGIGRRPGS